MEILKVIGSKLFVAILLALTTTNTNAEIHKEASMCADSGQICFYWWPKLPAIDGWQQDLRFSYHYRMNAQAPIASNFGQSETVIYARAEDKKANPDFNSLEEFISFSQQHFISGAPSKVTVTKTDEFETAGKQRFISYSFVPEGSGNWEQVSYGEDSDNDGNSYYIIITLSSRTEKGYKKTLPDYLKIVKQYK